MTYQFDPRIINLANGPLDSEKGLCFPHRNCDLMNTTQNNISRCKESENRKNIFKWHNKYAIELLNYMKKTYNQKPIYFNKKLGGYALWKDINVTTKDTKIYLFNDIIVKDIPFGKEYLTFNSKAITIKKVIDLTHFQKYIVNNIDEIIKYNNGILSITSVNLYQCILLYKIIIESNIDSKDIQLKDFIQDYIKKYKKYPRIQNKWCENFITTLGPIFSEEINDNITYFNVSNKPDEMPVPKDTKYYNGINFLPWNLGRECM